MADDPLWPRAAHWLGSASPAPWDLSVVGVPTWRTSISPTGAHATPDAVRAALARFSTWSWEHGVDLASVAVADLGDVSEPDGDEGHERVRDTVARAAASSALDCAIGGDNSATRPVVQGSMGPRLGSAGLITFDAHHDLRHGVSNGSPVRRLIDDGLDPRRIVQIGIADFSNSPAYAADARSLGITVLTRAAVRRRGVADCFREALSIAGADGAPVHVDLDVDVCDRSVVPGCPAAAPGGLSADELREAAHHAGRAAQVVSMDITEVDACADSPDGRTVRLAALCLLEAAAGLAVRRREVGLRA